jgi:predicted dehydrogenase
MNKNTISRKQFMETAGRAALGTTLAFNIGLPKTYAFNADTLKVALVGCGGRGTGAANQALTADPNVALTVVADVFPDKMEKSLSNLINLHPGKVKVDDDNKFLGFDAYKKVMESDVDVVILATPPAFRPDHLMAAVNAGKHIFCEKPMAVDVPGLKKIYEAARIAKEKELTLCSGFCWRFHTPKRETFSRILDGAVGEISTVYNTYNTGALWEFAREDHWTDMENTMRNWLYYNWLSGDHIAEQAVHSIDMMSWAMGDEMPISVGGTGGRQRRIEPRYGNVYDHFAIVYEYENGAKGFHFSRQQQDCARAYHVEVFGNKGAAMIDCIRRKHEIKADTNWRFRCESNDMYQQEHDELFASIRSGKPFNQGVEMANSTMLAIMGRMAAYTGQVITWEEAMQSEVVLGPQIDQYDWELEWPMASVAMPGITPFK